MPHRAILTHEDDIFGRVALFNNLVTLDQIIECARFIAAELTAGRPRRSLATVLILKNYLSPPMAGAVEAVVRRRLAAAGGAPQPETDAPTPKPPPLPERAPAGTSQVMVTIPTDAPPGGPIPDVDERLRKAVTRIAPGRIYPEMLNYVLKHRISIIDAKQLAAAIGESEKAVAAALHRWSNVGLLKKIGTHPYGFSPTPQEEEDIRLFLAAWNDPVRHAKALGFILAVEE